MILGTKTPRPAPLPDPGNGAEQEDLRSALSLACVKARNALNPETVSGALVFADFASGRGSSGLRFQITDRAPAFTYTHRQVLTPGAPTTRSVQAALSHPARAETRADLHGQYLRLTQGRMVINLPPVYSPLLAEAIKALIAREPGEAFSPNALWLCDADESLYCHGYAFHVSPQGHLTLLTGRWRPDAQKPGALRSVTLDLNDDSALQTLLSVTGRLATRTGTSTWDPDSAANATLLSDLIDMLIDLQRRAALVAPTAPHTVHYHGGTNADGALLHMNRLQTGRLPHPAARPHARQVTALTLNESGSGLHRVLKATMTDTDGVRTAVDLPGEYTLLLSRVLSHWTQTEHRPGDTMLTTCLSYMQLDGPACSDLTVFPLRQGHTQIETSVSTDPFALNIDQTHALKSAAYATARRYLQDLARLWQP